ncbi:MAG: ABC transporter substrate-binding protein [Pseudomonadota bacterium]
MMVRLILVLVAFTLFSVAARADQERIVSIGGSVTEIVYALGASDRLVAVDSTSLYPDIATELPDVGYMRRLSAEPILALEPDHILAISDAGPAPVLDQLREAGVKITVIDDEPSPGGIVDKIKDVALALDLTEQGQDLARQVEADFDALAEELNVLAASTQRLMFVLNTGRGAPMVGGTGTSADAIIRLAGAENAVTGLDGYKPLSPEAAIEAAPDVILTMNRSVEASGGKAALLALPDIALTPAGQNQALISMEGLLLLGFGPRTPEAARILAAALADLKPKPVN